VFGRVPDWFPAFVFDLVIHMLVDLLYGLFVLSYLAMVCLLFFLVWISIVEEERAMAYVFCSILVVWLGLGACAFFLDV
jgi:hypothetical protein